MGVYLLNTKFKCFENKLILKENNMKLHCYKSSEIKKALGVSDTLLVNEELIQVKFKYVGIAKDIILNETDLGNRETLLCIDSWTHLCRARAFDIKDTLFALGVTVYLVDEYSKEIVTKFVPKTLVTAKVA